METPTGSERALPAGSSLWTLSKPCRGEEQLPLVIPPSPNWRRGTWTFLPTALASLPYFTEETAEARGAD